MSTNTIEKAPETAACSAQGACGQGYVPATDIVETETEFLVTADVPGAKADAIDVNFERGKLTVTARVAPRTTGKPAFLLQEYGVGDYRRSFQIGEGIDVANIRAEVTGGVLTLHLPKAEARKTRKIAVATSG